MVVNYSKAKILMEDFGINTISEFKQILRDKSKEHTRLYDSFRTEINEDDSKIQMDIWMRDTAKYVHYGTEPGTRPKIDDIVSWLEYVSSYSKFSWVDLDFKYPLAYIISSNIEKNGIDAVPFLTPWYDNKDNLVEKLRDSLKLSVYEGLVTEFRDTVKNIRE